MREIGGGAKLALQARPVDVALVQHLERDGLARDRMMRGVHDAHAALADHAFDDVTRDFDRMPRCPRQPSPYALARAPPRGKACARRRHAGH